MIEKNKKTPNHKIIHILADGTQVDSIEGKVIPADSEFYRVYADIIRNHSKQEQEAG